MASKTFAIDDATRAKIRQAAQVYLVAELERLRAAGLLPDPGQDPVWIERRQLWRRRGRDAGAELAKQLEEWLPNRWTGPSTFPGAEELVEGLVRGYVAMRTLAAFRSTPPTGPTAAIDELLELIEHPEQPWRVMRLLLDVDTRAVDGRTLHDVRIRSVRGLRETISPEIPEAATEIDTVHVMLGSHEPRTFLIAERQGTDGWMVAFDVRPHLIHASTALRLVTAGTIVEPLEIYGQPRMVHSSGPGATAVDPEHRAHWRRVGVVESGQLDGIEAIATTLCALDRRAKDNIAPSLNIALGRFNRAHRAAPAGDTVIDIAIGLEAALTTGERHELTLRIKTRAANLLAGPLDSPDAIFRDIGELLRIRGSVAHGEPIPQKRWEDLFSARGLSQIMLEDRLAVLFDRWRDLLRRAIVARLLLDAGGTWPIIARPRDDIDEVLVDPIRRHAWRCAMRRRALELGIPTAIDPPVPMRDYLHNPYSDQMEH